MPKYTPPQVWQYNFSKHPLFAGYESVCRELGGNSWPNTSVLNHLALKKNVLNARQVPIQFSEQEAPRGQRSYETKIYQTGIVPTRNENWHDFLNACAWLTWPKLKAALNHIHCSQVNLIHTNVEHAVNDNKDVNFLARCHDTPTINDPFKRSNESDTATLFDESGAVLIGPDPRLAQWLIGHDWQNAFVTHRHLWQSHRLLVVGHAVLEKTLSPYPGMIAKVLYQPYPACSPNQNLDDIVKLVDTLLAKRWFNQAFTKPSDLFALPLLGLPGVDTQNEDVNYYKNEKVFRPLSSQLSFCHAI
jgi:hypothetical protein